MSTSIKSGDSGDVARVDPKKRLQTSSTTETAATAAAIEGDQFNIPTGPITLTTDNESGVIYIKNDEPEDVDWAIRALSVSLATSTGGSGDWRVRFNSGATTGTLITAGSDITIANLNLGSNKPLSATAKAGAEGQTLTNGTPSAVTVIPLAPGALTAVLDVVILPQGTTLGILVTPPTGNTSVIVTVNITLYRLVGD